MSHITPLDQEIIAWYESQSEETLRDLLDRFDADTPRKAWKAFFNDCTFPAQQRPSDSLAAPAEAGQGVCISVLSQTAFFRGPRGRWDAVCSGPLRNVTFSRVLFTAQARRA